ncbi:MAG TPA: hypothetical protein VGC06_20540 [Actinomycetes bacterium]
MHDDRASVEELAALRAAVLRQHDQLVRMLPGPRSLRLMGRLQRLHMSWLMLPWALVDARRMLRRGFPAGQEQAARLYRQLSGKDRHVAGAEVWRVVTQLGVLDERLRDPLGDQPLGALRGADPGELEAAAGALLGYYLAGRPTDDELLAQVQAAWGEYEELSEQQPEPGKRRGRRRAESAVDERMRAAADRYRVAWRRWLDRQAERGSATGPGRAGA